MLYNEARIEAAIKQAKADEKERRARIRRETETGRLDALGLVKDPAGVVVARHAGVEKGTPQTRAKLRPDTLQLLLKRGPERGISQDQHDAAILIRSAYSLIINADVGLGMKACSLETIGRGARKGDYETAWQVTVQGHYLDWVDAMAERAKAVMKYRKVRRWQVGPILDVVVDGMTCTEVEDARCLRNGSMGEHLREGLDLYNDIRFNRKRALEASLAKCA